MSTVSRLLYTTRAQMWQQSAVFRQNPAMPPYLLAFTPKVRVLIFRMSVVRLGVHPWFR